MSDRQVLLIGWRPEAVAALRRLGAEVTCVIAAHEDDRRGDLLDDAHTVVAQDPSATESTIAALERYGVDPSGFDTVTSQFEFTLVNAAVVGGERSPMTPRQALLLRDKDLQKQRIRAAGIPVADSALVVHPRELRGFAHPRGVLKPLDSSATRGMRTWSTDAERAAVADLPPSALGTGPWLAESWVDGAELHIDGVVRGGRVRFASVGRYLQNVIGIREGGLVASVLEHPGRRPELHARAREAAERVMTALDHRDGVFHLEVFEQPGGDLVFGECGGRIPGGSFDEMIRLQHGVDLHDEWARAVLGLPSAAVAAPGPTSFGDVFLATDPGTLVSRPADADVGARPGVRHTEFQAGPGDVLADASQASCVFAGTAVVEGDDEDQAAARIRELADWFRAQCLLTPPETPRATSPEAPPETGRPDTKTKKGRATVTDTVLTHITAPEGVAPSDGYTHVVTGPGQLAALAGQMPFDTDGSLVGEGDPEAQARQVFTNMRGCLAAAGGGFRDVVKLTYYVTDAAHIPVILAVRDEFVGTELRPASTVVQVAALYRPDLLLEVDAFALVNPATTGTGEA